MAATALVEAQQALHQANFRAALALTDSAEQRVQAQDTHFLADVHFLRGRIWTELQDFDRAQEAYQTALSLKPNYRGGWFNLGNNAFRQGQYNEALTFYRRGQKSHPNPTTLVHMGRAYKELGQVDSARQAYQQAITMDSSHAPAYARLSQLHREDGALEKALPHAQRALELDARNLHYRYLVGSLLYRMDQAEKALHYFRTVAAQQPWHYGAHYNLGQALMSLGHSEQARRYLARADSLRAVEEEVEKWQTLARLRPDEPARWATLGYVLRRAGRYEESIRAYKVALHLDPQHLDVRRAVANLMLSLGQAPEAIRHYQTVLRQDSSLVDVWLNLGIAYARSDQAKKARQAWETVLRYEPNHSTAETYLARLEER